VNLNLVLAVGAFNMNNMEQLQGIVDAAELVKAPVIIQASRGCIKYTEMNYLIHLIKAAVELHPTIPLVLHLDHGDNIETVKKCVAAGFTSVMIDASHFPYEQNVAMSKEVAEYAHKFGVFFMIVFCML
jgi:fructose-bisphosphate aldolase class II